MSETGYISKWRLRQRAFNEPELHLTVLFKASPFLLKHTEDMLFKEAYVMDINFF